MVGAFQAGQQSAFLSRVLQHFIYQRCLDPESRIRSLSERLQRLQVHLQVQVPRDMDLRPALGSCRPASLAQLLLCSPNLCAFRLHDKAYLPSTFASAQQLLRSQGIIVTDNTNFPTSYKTDHGRSEPEPGARRARDSFRTDLTQISVCVNARIVKRESAASS